MFLPDGEFSPPEVASRIVRGALLSGARAVCAERLARDWWCVWSDDDWFPDGDDVSVFEKVLPFTEAGPNSMRPEVLLTAFASHVVTWTPKGVRVINGTLDQEFVSFVTSRTGTGRVVAFRT